MLQDGIQGDSMGVGGYLIPRLMRSWALLDCVTSPPHPCLPGVQVPEVIFSDDGCQMALTPAEMVHNLSESYKLASITGGTVNASKLKMYHICFSSGRLFYGKGSISCALGQPDYQPQGLKTVGIPCVMGESSKPYIAAIAKLFSHVLARVRRTRPCESLCRMRYPP